MMYDDSGWGYWMMTLGLLLFLALVAVGVTVVVATRPRHASQPAEGPGRLHASAEALHELDLRFARGEIDEQAYERGRALLDRRRA